MGDGDVDRRAKGTVRASEGSVRALNKAGSTAGRGANEIERSEDEQQKQNKQIAAEQAEEQTSQQNAAFEDAPGPADALPAWRPFYAAVRDSMRRLREPEETGSE
ncbi:hypothetical protein PCCS19_54740 [Paenibacillus sp. CCS19]|uniref:hypothetical protein n=1 Tax=Paenibacillus sp. CCS19 TaxID=3158387 RepID=UPI0025639130|nr:hypothetical protein [Paenibacillus cellulosilyticus]GMK42414.1 hypothetical protein PCCS19_54740 [Paenibacillus cellulosilyticus]